MEASRALQLHLTTRLSHTAALPEADTLAEGFDRHAALRAFERAARIAPFEPDYHFVLGEALMREGRYRDALPACQEAARHQPDDATYQLALGEALWCNAQYGAAADAFRRAATLNARDADAWTGLGAALAAQSEYREAVEPLATAIRIERQRADAHNNLGIVMWQGQETSGALKHLRIAARRDTAAVVYHLNLGRMLALLRRWHEAEKTLKKAHQIAPAQPEPLVDLGDVLFAVGRKAEAAQAYQQALDLSPAALDDRPASRDAHGALLQDAIRGELTPQRTWVARLWLIAGGFAGGLAAFVRMAQRSLGRAGTAIVVIVTAALIFTSFHLGSAYLRHALFKDDLVSIAQTPIEDDNEVRALLSQAIEERGLAGHMQMEQCTIATRPRRRMIECRYTVPVRWLPWLSRDQAFTARVERPFYAEQKPIFLR
ncbi:MAG: tetratricopeptide repeat protein [Vicinamibacteria bacterium]|nr:tetratricopeptide repeat protein [Vicinamibacteria bacterium]